MVRENNGPPQSNLRRYIWDAAGSFARREGDELRLYQRGAFIELSPRAAFHNRGNIKSEGGAFIPAALFDGNVHPEVDVVRPSSPQVRAAKLVAVQADGDENESEDGGVG